MFEAVRTGGWDGLIGGSGKCLGSKGFVDKGFVDGHGHGSEQSNTYHRSSLRAMRSPELHQPGHTQRSKQLPSYKVATGPTAPVVLPPHDDDDDENGIVDTMMMTPL